MKKYEYVSVKVGTFFYYSARTAYREIIDKYAIKGYKYVGFVPTKQTGYGRIVTIDLIFEIDV